MSKPNTPERLDGPFKARRSTESFGVAPDDIDGPNGISFSCYGAYRVAQELNQLFAQTSSETTSLWIPVSERLPEGNASVIACCTNQEHPFREVISARWLRDNVDMGHITHWMPLPEAPK